MKQVLVQTAFAMAFAVMAVGCTGDTAGPSETGQVGLNILIDGEDVTSVAFVISGDAGTLRGNLNVNDENDPPIAATVMDLPPGPYTVSLTAFDSQGAALCTGSTEFTVVANQTVDANVVLQCGVTGEELLGNVNITGEFEFIVTNRCPRLHFLNAVPDEVPAEGSEVTVLVSDADGDPLTTALTATSGTFADPSAQLTTYFCDGAAGGQTISVTVSDGDAACDKSKSFDVTCPGVNPCEGVECPDTGNQCTVGICTDQSAPDCEETNVTNGLACDAGGIVDVAEDGSVESGTLDAFAQFCDGNNGTCSATQDEANTGSWSANVATTGAPANPLIKQANKGIGVVQPNSPVTVKFFLKGSAGPGGVVTPEVFSEIDGGGASGSTNLGNLIPTDVWTPYEFTVTTAGDVSGGVTLQLAAICGAVQDCSVNAYFDDISITIEGSGPGSCQDGVCEPDDLCDGVICDDQNECTIDTCAEGNCSFTPDEGVRCEGDTGTCNAAGVCVPDAECSVAGDCPDDGNECTDPVCNAGVCETSNNTSACEDGTGTCDAGACVPNEVCEYTQDFETYILPPPGQTQFPPNSLSNDGWLVGGNEFESDGTFFNSYFAFPAPNGGPAFCAAVAGEGGAAQGAQQMSIYNDYNNANHGDGPPDLNRIIEAVVFRERDIVAADVGTTLTFTFDAKSGNIEGASTAEAFIQVLDSLGGGFGVIVFDTEPTTSLATWNENLTVSVPIDASLVGQLLQYGARSRASNFEGSGVFYDNMSVCSTPTP